MWNSTSLVVGPRVLPQRPGGQRGRPEHGPRTRTSRHSMEMRIYTRLGWVVRCKVNEGTTTPIPLCGDLLVCQYAVKPSKNGVRLLRHAEGHVCQVRLLVPRSASSGR